VGNKIKRLEEKKSIRRKRAKKGKVRSARYCSIGNNEDTPEFEVDRCEDNSSDITNDQKVVEIEQFGTLVKFRKNNQSFRRNYRYQTWYSSQND
jgi:hypothetical protein